MATPDPLAELARLVGQDDPYRSVFRSAAAPAVPPANEQDWPVDPGAPDEHDPHPGHGGFDETQPALWHDDAEHGHDADAAAWAEHDEADDRHLAYADDDRHYAIDAATHRDDAGIADNDAAVDAASAAIPDLWARDDRAAGAAPEVDRSFAADGERSRGGGSARRPMLVLGAVLLLTGGGLAASFMQKGGTTGSVAAASGSGAPTILAAAGPTKVKQDDPSATAPEDKDAALLNKGAGVVSGPVKVVQSEEQPADLGQLPKAGDGTSPATPQSPFPEAKKVKTFVVHPDGTPLYDDGPQTATNSTPPAPVPSSAPAPLASTPKAVVKSATTPPASSIASLVNGDPTADAPAPAVAAPVAAAAPKAAKPKAAASAGTGGFGLQLAASPSEAEANAAFAKLKKKYPTELGALSANVHESETGGKPVYRVRVGGMTHDEANALCSKLKVGGGSCFVVHD